LKKTVIFHSNIKYFLIVSTYDSQSNEGATAFEALGQLQEKGIRILTNSTPSFLQKAPLHRVAR
jgi:hypothetical protein